MSDGFANPIIGGGGGLVYPSIHSPNYVPGVSGWTVKKDGSSEFSNVTIRGTIIGALIESRFGNWQIDTDGNLFVFNASGAVLIRLDSGRDGLFIYTDTGSAVQGQLVASITNGAGNDAFGAPYQNGITAYQGGTANWVRMLAAALQWPNSASASSGVATGGADSDALILQSGLSHFTQLVLDGANTLITSPLRAQDPAKATPNIETWHTITPAGWTGSIRYRLGNDNEVRISIQATITAAGTTTLGTLPPPYRPNGPNTTVTVDIAQTSGTFNNLRVDLTSAGVLTIRGVPAASTVVGAEIHIPLD